MTSRKILGLAVGMASGAASAARHPVATAGYVVGFAKGAGTATIGAVRRVRRGESPVPQQRATTGPTIPTQPAGERTLYGGLNTEAAPPRMPGGGGEEFGHEPHAESREVEHGEAATQPREVDSWSEEAADSEIDLETPVGNPDTAGADLQPDTEPLVDPAIAKAIRSEAETMAKAADPDKG